MNPERLKPHRPSDERLLRLTELTLVNWLVLQLKERNEQWAENRACYHARPPQQPRIHLPRTKVRYS